MVLFQKEGTGALSLEQWAGEGRLWLFFRLLGGFLLYLLPLFCCGLFSFGAYGVLLLFGARGFTLACWVGEFCRDYGPVSYTHLNQANEELDKLVGVRTRQIQRTLRDAVSYTHLLPEPGSDEPEMV